MSTLFVPWVVFPLLLAVLSLGCGLLLERASALRLPGPLILPCGFAVLALVADLAVTTATTARLAVPAVVATAIAGFGLAFGRLRRLRPDGWAVAAGVGGLAAHAAPIVLSGRATFAGYIKLDDDSTLVALVDRAMTHGRSVAGLEPSTYLRVLDGLLIHGYPLATFMPLGVGHTLLRTDSLWLYQPCMAFMSAMLALALYQLCVSSIERGWLRTIAAIVAAQAALLYGYALWGGIKEVGTAWAVPLLAALVPQTIRSDRLRNLMPLAAVTALLLGVLSVGAAVWAAPALAFVLVTFLRQRGLRATLRASVAFVAFLAVFAVPTIVAAPDFVSSTIRSFDPLTNLLEPLNPLQVAGIWPVGDFRVRPTSPAPTYVVVAVALAAAAVGVVWAFRRGSRDLPLYVVGALASAMVLYWTSTPWIAGKAFATASPAIPLAALVLAALLARTGRAIEAAVLGIVIVGGVLWSNVLQYREASLGPRSQLAELSVIGDRFAGDSPALMTEYQPYGVRHFLRRLDAEGASELRVRPVQLRTGGVLDKGETANIDDFSLDAVLAYRTLVLRRSASESRPPSAYRLTWRGRWYDVWQRPPSGARRILEHLSLGDDLQPAAPPSCREVLRLAHLAGRGGQLAAVRRPPADVVDLTTASFPQAWRAESGQLVPSGSGTVRASVSLPAPARYGIWLGGSFRGGVELDVDGTKVAERRNQLNWTGMYTPLGDAALGPGIHQLELRYRGPDWHPGSGGAQFPLGPLVFSRTTAEVPVTYVKSSDARSLCGRSLDWVEALAS